MILSIGVGIWFAIHRSKKSRLKKTQSATPTDATTSPTDKDNTTATATTTNTTDPGYNAASALEMGTAEGNTHELSTRDNAHELYSPDRLHEMGDLAPEYGAEGDIHVEGDVAAEGTAAAEGDMYPQGDHGKYDDEKGKAAPADLKQRGSTDVIAELEGDVAFPEGSARGRGQGGGDGEAPKQEEGKESVGKGFVLTE